MSVITTAIIFFFSAIGKARYYQGRVSGFDVDGKYNIVYVDGDTEKHVGREYVRVTSVLKKEVVTPEI